MYGIYSIYLFLVSIKEQTSALDTGVTHSESPSPRTHSGLAFKHNTLFVYGGNFEKGSKSFTLNDLYSLGEHNIYVLYLIYLNIKFNF